MTEERESHYNGGKGAHTMEITDFNRPELDVYVRKTENQLVNREHPEQGIFIAESPRVILRALNSGCRPISFLMEQGQPAGDSAAVLDQCPHVPVYTAKHDLLKKMTGFPLTRGMLCAMVRPRLKTPEEICRNARRIAVLEDVVNPTNVGAIFRSAAALNMDAVLLTPACSDPLYRRAARVSMGTVFQVPWAWIGEDVTQWPHPGMDRLKKMGFCTAAMALRQDTVSIRDPRLMQEEKLAILLGTEGEGLGEETLVCCDYTIKIPMTHGVDSLNVAAASAVAFYQLG